MAAAAVDEVAAEEEEEVVGTHQAHQRALHVPFCVFRDRDPRLAGETRKHQRRIPSIPGPSRQEALPPNPHNHYNHTTQHVHEKHLDM